MFFGFILYTYIWNEFIELFRLIQQVRTSLLFGCPTANFRPLSRGQPHSPDVNHCVLHFRPEDHGEPRNEVGSLSPASHIFNQYNFYLVHFACICSCFLHYMSLFSVINQKYRKVLIVFDIPDLISFIKSLTIFIGTIKGIFHSEKSKSNKTLLVHT